MTKGQVFFGLPILGGGWIFYTEEACSIVKTLHILHYHNIPLPLTIPLTILKHF